MILAKILEVTKTTRTATTTKTTNTVKTSKHKQSKQSKQRNEQNKHIIEEKEEEEEEEEEEVEEKKKKKKKKTNDNNINNNNNEDQQETGEKPTTKIMAISDKYLEIRGSRRCARFSCPFSQSRNPLGDISNTIAHHRHHSTTGQIREKHRKNSDLIIHCPMSKGVSEVSE